MKRFLILLSLLIALIPWGQGHAQDDASGWLYAQINALRASQGLHGYTVNPTLSSLAQIHSQYMASSGILSHEDAAGNTATARARAAGYMGGIYVGENIYTGINPAPNDAWNWWLGSSVHYNAIIDRRFYEVGIGIAEGNGRYYFTLMFGMGGEGLAVVEEAPPPENPVAPAESAEESQAQPEWGPVVMEAPPQAVAPAPQVEAPRILFTALPTLPTHTPTMTWTPTATWTPSPTPTIPPATSTPIILPTAAPWNENEVALAPSETPQTVIQLSQPDEIGIVALPPNESMTTLEVVNDGEGGLNWRWLLPFIITIQVGGLAWVFRRLWRIRR